MVTVKPKPTTTIISGGSATGWTFTGSGGQIIGQPSETVGGVTYVYQREPAIVHTEVPPGIGGSVTIEPTTTPGQYGITARNLGQLETPPPAIVAQQYEFGTVEAKETPGGLVVTTRDVPMGRAVETIIEPSKGGYSVAVADFGKYFDKPYDPSTRAIEQPLPITKAGMTEQEALYLGEYRRARTTPYRYKAFRAVETPIEVMPGSPAELGLPLIEMFATGYILGGAISVLPRVAQIGVAAGSIGLIGTDIYEGVTTMGPSAYFSQPQVLFGYTMTFGGAYAGAKTIGPALAKLAPAFISRAPTINVRSVADIKLISEGKPSQVGLMPGETHYGIGQVGRVYDVGRTHYAEMLGVKIRSFVPDKPTDFHQMFYRADPIPPTARELIVSGLLKESHVQRWTPKIEAAETQMGLDLIGGVRIKQTTKRFSFLRKDKFDTTIEAIKPKSETLHGYGRVDVGKFLSERMIIGERGYYFFKPGMGITPPKDLVVLSKTGITGKKAESTSLSLDTTSVGGDTVYSVSRGISQQAKPLIKVTGQQRMQIIDMPKTPKQALPKVDVKVHKPPTQADIALAFQDIIAPAAKPKKGFLKSLYGVSEKTAKAPLPPPTTKAELKTMAKPQLTIEPKQATQIKPLGEVRAGTDIWSTYKGRFKPITSTVSGVKVGKLLKREKGTIVNPNVIQHPLEEIKPREDIGVGLLPGLGLGTGEGVGLALRQITPQKPKQPQRTVDLIDVPIEFPRIKPPPPPPLRSREYGGRLGRKMGKRRHLLPRTRYQPSLVAKVFEYYGKKPKFITGLEAFRPMEKKRKRREK